jgi:hypothetical protein
MKLLGEGNWFLPRWLNLLPQVSHEAGPEPIPDRPILTRT